MIDPCNSFERAGVKLCTIGNEFVTPFNPIYVQKYTFLANYARIMLKNFVMSDKSCIFAPEFESKCLR